jgi:hypothetical protein
MTPFYSLIGRVKSVLSRQTRRQTLVFLAPFCILTSVLPAYSQACYTPISGTAVQVGGIANTTICAGQLCLGTLGYNELQKITDNSLDSYASLSGVVAAQIAQGISVKKTSGTFTGDNVVGFILSRSGVADLSVLSSVTIRTYLNGNPVSADQSLSSLLSGSLLGSTEKMYATFTTNQEFNEIRLNTSTLSAEVLGSLRIYAAVAFPTTCSSAVTTTSCNDFISGVGTDATYYSTVSCALCTVSSLTSVVSGNNTDYAILTPAANAVATTAISVIDTKNKYAGGQRVGFVISRNAANALLAANALGTVTIKTYLFGTLQESRSLSDVTNVVDLALLAGNTDVPKQKLKFTTTAGKDFNEVRIEINSVVGVTLGAIRVYGAFVEATSCTDCQTLLGSSPTGVYSGSIVTGNQTVSFLNVQPWTGVHGAGLHVLTSSGNAVSSVTNDFATYTSVVSILGAGLQFTVENDGTDFPANKTFAGFHISKTGSLVSLDLLNAITIKVYNGDGDDPVDVSTGASLLGASLISGSTAKSVIGFYPDAAFDRIQLVIDEGLISADLAGDYLIYDAFVIEDTDGDGVPNCQDPASCTATANDLLDFDGDGISDDCDPDDDNDGILDTRETTTLNTDGDLYPDYHDLDSDNDGILDTDEKGTAGDNATNPVDTDGDGKSDYVDLDSDNDGINDVIETDGTDDDNNGIADGAINGVTGVPASANGLKPANTDGTDNPDYRDLDSDNDGIPDLYESGISNPSTIDGTTKDGKIEAADGGDNDGIPQNVDGATGSFGDANSPDLPNADRNAPNPDFVPNYRDLDSDNDGIRDEVEKGPNASDGTNPINSDPDGLPDYIDLDSDNDGINDVVEAGGTDADHNGVADGVPSTTTGVPSSVTAPTGLNPPNTDGTDTPDYRDLDSDNDGTKDLYESTIANPASLDTDGDGVVDAADGTDNDGIPQTVDGLPNNFGDADLVVDLTPTNLMPVQSFTAVGQSLAITITVKNLTAGTVTNKQVTVTVTKPTQYMTVAFSGSAGDEWDLTDSGSFFKLVSKTGVTITGSAVNAKNIGLTLTVTAGANSGASTVNTRIQSLSGGETNFTNNTALTSANITF